MHDIRFIREEPEVFDAALAKRALEPMAQTLLALDQERRHMILEAETAQSEQKKAAKAIGAAKAKGDTAEFERLRATVSEQKASVTELQEKAKILDAQLIDALARIPNLPHDGVPEGQDEDDNVELRRWGTPRTFSFAPKEHYEIAGAKDGLDFETAAKISGARYVILRGTIARLHRALAQFMLDLHVNDHGLTETWTPVLVRQEAMYGTDKLPKFGDDSYQTTDGSWLIPTSEVTLTYSVAETMLEATDLPRRMTAHTQCFRSEAGSAGRDTAGMLRQHQFEKVEMVSVTHPDHSMAELDRMTRCAETILERLELPYRTVVLCTGDMGFGARRTHDIEVWLPGQQKYREISSCSVCGDFQARRMNARFKPEGGGKPEFVHTLNGSGLAVGRCLIAVLEYGQQEDGSIQLPGVLAPYLGGKSQITALGALV